MAEDVDRVREGLLHDARRAARVLAHHLVASLEEALSDVTGVRYATSVGRVAFARTDGSPIDGGVQLAVEGDEHAQRAGNTELGLVDGRLSCVAQSKALAAERLDERRLVHNVNVAVLDAQTMHSMIGAACTPAADDDARGVTCASLVERDKEGTYMQHAIALVADSLETLLGGQVLAVATLHLAVVLAPWR